jgi:hypothetical protein
VRIAALLPSLVLTAALVVPADAEPPSGLYHLEREASIEARFGEKTYPSCGHEAKAWFETAGTFNVVWLKATFRVNSAAWKLVGHSAEAVTARHPESTDQVRIQVGFFVPNRGKVTGAVLYWRLNEHGGTTCADLMRYTGTYTARP